MISRFFTIAILQNNANKTAQQSAKEKEDYAPQSFSTNSALGNGLE